MDIKLNAEDINKFVKDAILSSSIGDLIKKTIDKLMTGYNNPIEQALGPVIKDIAYSVIRENFLQQIEDQIRAVVAEKVTKEMTQNVVEKVVEKMGRAMRDEY